jgi:hypothetical protein
MEAMAVVVFEGKSIFPLVVPMAAMEEEAAI